MTARALFAQAAAGGPEFEAAIIKPYKAGAADESGHVFPGGELSLGNVTMTGLVQFAYSVRENAIVNKPSWFKSGHFDVIAKAPPGAPAPALRLMMQSLLASEFKLRVHHETRLQDAFALVVASGGPRLHPAAGPVSPGCARAVSANANQRHDDCYDVTMADFAERLPNEASSDIDRPVVDLTGISGRYDLQLDWAGGLEITPGGPSIFEALRTQLGLGLEPRKLPLPMIVIDHVEPLARN